MFKYEFRVRPGAPDRRHPARSHLACGRLGRHAGGAGERSSADFAPVSYQVVGGERVAVDGDSPSWIWRAGIAELPSQDRPSQLRHGRR